MGSAWKKSSRDIVFVMGRMVVMSEQISHFSQLFSIEWMSQGCDFSADPRIVHSINSPAVAPMLMALSSYNKRYFWEHHGKLECVQMSWPCGENHYGSQLDISTRPMLTSSPSSLPSNKSSSISLASSLADVVHVILILMISTECHTNQWANNQHSQKKNNPRNIPIFSYTLRKSIIQKWRWRLCRDTNILW